MIVMTMLSNDAAVREALEHHGREEHGPVARRPGRQVGVPAPASPPGRRLPDPRLEATCVHVVPETRMSATSYCGFWFAPFAVTSRSWYRFWYEALVHPDGVPL